MVEKVREERLVAGIQSKHLLAQAVTIFSTLLLSSTFSSALLISFLFLLFLVSFLFYVHQFLTFSRALCFQCALIFQILYHILCDLQDWPGRLQNRAWIMLIYCIWRQKYHSIRPLKRNRNYIAHMRVTVRELSGERICCRPVQLVGRCVRLFLHFALAHAVNSFPSIKMFKIWVYSQII
jgi:hypothetical protein